MADIKFDGALVLCPNEAPSKQIVFHNPDLHCGTGNSLDVDRTLISRS